MCAGGGGGGASVYIEFENKPVIVLHCLRSSADSGGAGKCVMGSPVEVPSNIY